MKMCSEENGRFWYWSSIMFAIGFMFAAFSLIFGNQFLGLVAVIFYATQIWIQFNPELTDKKMVWG